MIILRAAIWCTASVVKAAVVVMNRLMAIETWDRARRVRKWGRS